MAFTFIDDIKYFHQGPFSVYQFCFFNNINLPCFCYHEKLSIAGNCRICLVEVNNNLVVSCAFPLLDGSFIYTNSLRVKQAREGVMEFLLIIILWIVLFVTKVVSVIYRI
jgi:NADH-quinone oxidoreductase subunit G